MFASYLMRVFKEKVFKCNPFRQTRPSLLYFKFKQYFKYIIIYIQHLIFRKRRKCEFKARNLCCVLIFQPLIPYLSSFRNKSDLFLYIIRNLENSRLKTVFQYRISICICVGRWRILNGYCVVEKYLFEVLKNTIPYTQHEFLALNTHLSSFSK